MSDRASQLITTALDDLSAALTAGHSQALTAVLKTMARFHRYSHVEPALDRGATARRHSRGRLPHLAVAGPARPARREGHRHPRAAAATAGG